MKPFHRPPAVAALLWLGVSAPALAQGQVGSHLAAGSSTTTTPVQTYQGPAPSLKCTLCGIPSAPVPAKAAQPARAVPAQGANGDPATSDAAASDGQTTVEEVVVTPRSDPAQASLQPEAVPPVAPVAPVAPVPPRPAGVPLWLLVVVALGALAIGWGLARRGRG